MNQPKKSISMTLRLLALWAFAYFKKTISKIKNTNKGFARQGENPRYAVQGQLPTRLKIVGKYFELEEIIKLAEQSQDNNDDVFFDHRYDASKILTVRVARANKTSFTLEILPDAETTGVFMKDLDQGRLLAELTLICGEQSNVEYESNDYRYVSW